MGMVYVETLEEFEAKNGGMRLQFGGRWWFPSGASMPPDGRVFYAADPSPFKRLRRQIDYWEVALERAVKDFDEAQAGFLNQAAMASRYRNLPGMQVDAEQILTKLKEVVQDCRMEIEFYREKLEQTPEMQSIREDERYRIKMKSQMHLAVGRISSIKLDN